MTERVSLKPAPLEIEGTLVPRKVRKPVGTYLAADGEEVNLDTYWRRKLDAGEVEVVTPTAVTTTVDAAPAATDDTAKKTKAA